MPEPFTFYIIDINALGMEIGKEEGAARTCRHVCEELDAGLRILDFADTVNLSLWRKFDKSLVDRKEGKMAHIGHKCHAGGHSEASVRD